ncbi:LrgB family protein [Inhella sp.]|uniref:LrgB family protein n=1 Tax=Inhella sp. TaxID=1921806 RepID=UPI0035B39B41
MSEPLLPPLRTLWVYLGASPLLWLLLTLAAYLAAVRVQQRLGGSPFANPVLLAVALLVAVLVGTGTPYPRYFEGAQFVHFLLGTATVALAVPLRLQWQKVRERLGSALLTLLAGNVVGALLVVGVLRVFDAPISLIATAAPRGVTAPVAMAVAQQLGGLPALTAVLVIASGVIGALIATPLLNALRIDDWPARGLAVGMAAHGIGTARAFQVNAVAGTFAGMAMACSTVITASLLPLLAPWLLS